MGYSNYKKIESVAEKFGLDTRLIALFGEVEKVAPSSWLTETLNMARPWPLRNEKTKSERIISPILLEIAQSYLDKVSFFSGEQTNIKPEDDLSGECDFFFSLHPPKPFMGAPIISLAEAKNEDMNWVQAQCAAQMLGAKLYNEAKHRDIPCVASHYQTLSVKNESDST